MTVVIDRIEDGICVCEEIETEKRIKFDLSQIPEGAKEGDVLIYENNELKIDEQETLTRRKIIEDLMDGIF